MSKAIKVSRILTADNHTPRGEDCRCGLKDYEHAWWAGWNAGDSESAKDALYRRKNPSKVLTV